MHCKADFKLFPLLWNLNYYFFSKNIVYPPVLIWSLPRVYISCNISMPSSFPNMFSKYDAITINRSARGSFCSQTTRQCWYLQLVVRGRLLLHGCLQASVMWCHVHICLAMLLCLLPWQVMKALKQSIAFPEMRGEMTVTAGCHEIRSLCSLCNQIRQRVADVEHVFSGMGNSWCYLFTFFRWWRCIKCCRLLNNPTWKNRKGGLLVLVGLD